VVAETLNLSQVPGYCIGGTIHIILNNQIGFTTSPKEGRSTLYSSDLAKGFEIPIIHVNADDPGACIAAARMALAYCTQFHKDFLIDLVGYRRWGHNEGDEPAYTQPRMYEVIASHPTVRDIWARGMVREDILTREETEEMVKSAQKRLQDAREEAANLEVKHEEEFGAKRSRRDRPVDTSVFAERLIEMNEALLARPEGFIVVPKLERSLQRRRQALQEEKGIDWGHAETLAFASILSEGTPIRLTGQDSERGTFSHRHLVLHDPHTGQKYSPLQSLPQARASFAIHNSPLSENAVLGFEYGYSMHATETLVLWEAQFGDFANGAQVIIDQFIVAGNAKWQQTPSLVLLLPHGYEGQGPEHSSARLERFLQLAAGDNIRVVNCTTSAQFFHVLRRQAALLETVPRPLIVMSPKSLLRHPMAGSSLSELSEGRFHPVLDDPRGPERANQVTRLVMCSGKIYVDLLAHEAYEEADRVAVIRLEELNPFPVRELREAISRYPHVQEVVWMQEEPRNMGAWVFAQTRIRDLFGPEINMLYVGRPASSSPAEGSLQQHRNEQNRIITTALNGVPELRRNGSSGPQRERKEVTHVG
jgi:2-oxoglutarate dehydrogenase E1 component